MKVNIKMKPLDITKLLSSYNKGKSCPYLEHQFIADCKRYIEAIKEERIFCCIGSVALRGNLRTIKFVEMGKIKGDKGPFLKDFFQLFNALGFKPAIATFNYFRVHDCGHEVAFHANYTVIQELERLGFINAMDCKSLSHSTLHII